MRIYTFILVVLMLFCKVDAKASGVDSLTINSQFITLGEAWYTDYFTSYAVYTNRSFFKDENGGLHIAFIANYELYYCHSLDSGNTWSTDHILSTHDGDFREAVIYADEEGNPFIAVTVNPYYNYGNPTGIAYGDEFRYSVYFLYKDELGWMEEEVYNSTLDPSFSGNYGCRVNELYKNMEDELVLIGHRYGWYTYGGEIWEFVRDTEGTWSGLSIIHAYNDTPIDHSTEVSRSYLKSTGERDLIYTRPYNPNGQAELVNLHYDGAAWSAPNVLTTDLVNHASWDLSISADEDMYLVHFSNDPIPHVNMYTDFEESTELDIDLSLVDTIQAVKVHITKDEILDLIVYPFNSDTALLYVSEDMGDTWGDPLFLAKNILPGVLPVTDQFSSQGSDLEYMRIRRVSSSEPYGPDSLFYSHIEQINTTALTVANFEMYEDRLTFYPNPVTEEVTISYSIDEATELDLRIFTIQGKVVYSESFMAEPGSSIIKRNLGFLDAGSYIIEVYEKDQPKDGLHQDAKKMLKLPLN